MVSYYEKLGEYVFYTMLIITTSAWTIAAKTTRSPHDLRSKTTDNYQLMSLKNLTELKLRGLHPANLVHTPPPSLASTARKSRIVHVYLMRPILPIVIFSLSIVLMIVTGRIYVYMCNTYLCCRDPHLHAQHI